MRISLDVSDHWQIRGGIWRYGVGLARALAGMLPPGSVRIVCFDRLPPDRLQELADTGAQVRAAGPHTYVHRLQNPELLPARPLPLQRIAPMLQRRGVPERLIRGALRGSGVCHYLFHSRVPVPRAACVSTVYDLTPIILPHCHGFGAEPFRQLLLRHRDVCDRVVAISEATKRDLVAHVGYDPSRVHVVHLGADLEHLRPRSDVGSVLARHGLVEDQYLLYVGTLEPRKNLNVLLDAYLAARQGGVELPLVLAGTMGWQMEAFEKRLKEPEIGRHVHHLGFVAEEDLPALYSGARCFVYVSIYEGFGFPPLEAMACGAPVVTSNSSSLPEVVGDAGLQVDPESPVEIARALIALVENQELRGRLREAGLRRARRFTWEAAARGTLEVYREAAASAGKR